MLLLYIVKQKNTNAFTLLEILIVVVVIAVLAIATLILLNPKNIYNHALDTTRKSDLSRFKKALEEYYNDKGCYPPPNKVCYTGGDNGNPVGNNCYVCGKEVGSPSFSPYLVQLPCDPNYPTKKYLYVVDNVGCPKNYRVYTKFNAQNDTDSVKVGCALAGCGPSKGYDYGESSPNVALDVTKVYYCKNYNPPYSCDNCGTYDQCAVNLRPMNPVGVCSELFNNKAACQAAQ